MSSPAFKQRTSKLCVIGSANVDLIFRSPRFPRPGETLAGHSFQQCLGGKGANQAVAAARLDADVTFIACVGQDQLGNGAVEQYRAEGIDTTWIRRVENQPTGTAAIIVEDSAENCIIVVPGANAELSDKDVERAAAVIAESDAVLCQLETPIQTTLAAFRCARAANVMTVLTPAPVAELPQELLQLCDVCVPNRTEIERLVGVCVRTIDEARFAVSLLLKRGVNSAVLTLGSDGALVADRHQSVLIPPTRVAAVDTTGAGDAFCAALSVYLGEGLSLVDAAHRASRAAAISVTRHGTQTSFATRAELDVNIFPSTQTQPLSTENV